MHKFVRNLLTEWRKLGLSALDGVFVVAVSGGADSMSLAAALYELKRLKKLNARFVVAHFNHDLRGEESAADELFVKKFAESQQLELACGKIRNPASKIKNKPGNLEQNARLARYDFLLETARNTRADGILTAHTLNDQAETFLLNLIRGSGLEGLSGIKPLRSFSAAEYSSDSPSVENKAIEMKNTGEGAEKDGESEICEQPSRRDLPPEIFLARPLLNWATRARTENFCLENRIEFRRDSMNDDLAFRRVRIRKILLPMLADFNPKIVEILAKTANLLREDFAELEQSAAVATEKFRSETTNSENVLHLKELKNLFPSTRRRILRQWLKAHRGSLRRLGSKHLEAVENLSENRKSGRKIELPGGEAVIKSGGKLFFEKSKVDKTSLENYNQGLDFGNVPDAIENND